MCVILKLKKFMFRVNDKSAIRFRKTKYTKEIISLDVYKEWIAENPEYVEVTYQDFKLYWRSIAEKVRWHIINNPMGVHLPFYCGDIRVQYIPKSVKVPNIPLGTQLGQVIYDTSLLTKGKGGKISWVRKYASRYNPLILLYCYEPIRDIRRGVKAKIEEAAEIYRNSTVNYEKPKYNDNKSGDNI